jgi:hypothetical protein
MEWQARKGRKAMTKDFVKMAALSLASILLLAAAAFVPAGM